MTTFTRREFLKGAARTAAAVGIGAGAGRRFGQARVGGGDDFDLLIRGGTVYDGLGGEGIAADLGISGSEIKSMGRLARARAEIVIDASGLAVSPGFIDVHDHTAAELLVNSRAESAVRQGVTTLISGNCGGSPFPVTELTLADDVKALKEEFGLDLTWRDLGGFFARLRERGIAVNYATLVGQGSVRTAAMGFNDKKPTSSELELMKTLTARAMEQGALGLSTGLEYTPGSFAATEEIIELARVAARHGGLYATHMRDEKDNILEAIDEAASIARDAGLPLQISHFKIGYPRNWSKLDQALAKVEAARRDGVDVFCDRYPYIAGATGLSLYFPMWAREGRTEDFIARLKDPALQDKLRTALAEVEKSLGSWDKILLSSVHTEKNVWVEGKTVREAAAQAGKDAYEFMRDLLIEEEGRVGMIAFVMCEDNLRRILAHPLVGLASDGAAVAPYGILGKGKPHPRLYGTFPRALGRYVREEKLLPLAEMIRKITSIPARRFRLEGRGVLRPGAAADIAVFDPARIIDRATWTDPAQYPLGVEYVVVNGALVVEKGEHTGRLPGRTLKRGEKA
ncbi:MAG: D-aminoacylase [Candidatus Aminicenantes bacterium]|nr:D-aminoacylase [Candidatus Aminicenantes bacterium]